jgi:hypothetical protein
MGSAPGIEERHGCPQFIQLAAAAVTLGEMHLKLGRQSGRRSDRIKQQACQLGVHFRAILVGPFHRYHPISRQLRPALDLPINPDQTN